MRIVQTYCGHRAPGWAGTTGWRLRSGRSRWRLPSSAKSRGGTWSSVVTNYYYYSYMYDCPIRYGLDGVQTVTYVCHGLDDHPGQSRIGHPIRDWDWTLFKIIQSQSQIGCPIRDLDWASNLWHPTVTDWTSNPSHRLDIQTMTGIGHFLKSSNPSHGLDIQSVTPYCHGLDVQSKSWIGHANRTWFGWL